MRVLAIVQTKTDYTDPCDLEPCAVVETWQVLDELDVTHPVLGVPMGALFPPRWRHIVVTSHFGDQAAADAYAVAMVAIMRQSQAARREHAEAHKHDGVPLGADHRAAMLGISMREPPGAEVGPCLRCGGSRLADNIGRRPQLHLRRDVLMARYLTGVSVVHGQGRGVEVVTTYRESYVYMQRQQAVGSAYVAASVPVTDWRTVEVRTPYDSWDEAAAAGESLVEVMRTQGESPEPAAF